MLENDAALIRKVWSGDDSAFSALVEKYQKGVHALVWRKIGDFHHAQDITQDTFVQAYKKLGTLKYPENFSGWLYVIANRLSLNWIQRQKPMMQSLEDIPVEEIEESSYKNYMSEQRQTEVAEHRSEVVKKLLQRLPESERTVVTLYYLGEMTTQEIGKFLGVSANTIKSRLRRGRERLRESEPFVSEVLSSVQLSPDVLERVMRQVVDMNPTAASPGKPLLPWSAFWATTALILLMIGVGNQYLSRFQRPYSFEAQSEPTIEIVEAPIVIDTVSKPALQKQVGQISVPSKNSGTGRQVSEVTLKATGEMDRLQSSTAQWTQTSGPPGGHVRDIFVTSNDHVYAFASTGIYKLVPDATTWTRLNATVPMDETLMPAVEHQGKLYIVSTEEIFVSADNGETWNAFCTRPTGESIGLIIIDAAEHPSRHADMTLYLALRDEGIFRSTDNGRQWDALNDSLIAERMTALAAIEKTVFVGTNSGLYRLDAESWEKSPIGGSETIYSLTVFENRLYVAIGPDLFKSTPTNIGQRVNNNQPSVAKIFYSADFGESWEDITPGDTSIRAGLPSGIKVLAVGETLFAVGATQFRSTDGGAHWTNLGLDANAFLMNYIPSVAVNERTFYKVGASGIRRSTDGGESWELFMNGVIGTRIKDLVAFNNRLYTYNGAEVFQSVDAGVSWEKVRVSDESGTLAQSRVNLEHDSKLLVAGNMLYLLSPTRTELRIFGLSADENVLIPIGDVPRVDRDKLSSTVEKGHQDTRQMNVSEVALRSMEERINANTFAIIRDVFYVEYSRGLYKWKRGEAEWTHTGFVDTSKQPNGDLKTGLKLAVFGETVYVGKRDGTLFQSRDAGEHWKDITPNLPFGFTHVKEIAFAGSTVYVSTDTGVFLSETGEDWDVVRDEKNKPPVINQLAVAGRSVYGAGDQGVYRLKTRRQWERISSDIRDKIVALVTLNNKLYGVSEHQGLFYMLLDPVE